jgi:hypothetical protein
VPVLMRRESRATVRCIGRPALPFARGEGRGPRRDKAVHGPTMGGAGAVGRGPKLASAEFLFYFYFKQFFDILGQLFYPFFV